MDSQLLLVDSSQLGEGIWAAGDTCNETVGSSILSENSIPKTPSLNASEPETIFSPRAARILSNDSASSVFLTTCVFSDQKSNKKRAASKSVSRSEPSSTSTTVKEKRKAKKKTKRKKKTGWPKELNPALSKKKNETRCCALPPRWQFGGNYVEGQACCQCFCPPTLNLRWGKKMSKARGGKKEVVVPDPVLEYNQGMGGVDLADQHAVYYSIGQPSVRWWRYIYWWLFQTAMVNSFILWKETNKPAPKTSKRHLNFRVAVLRALCKWKVCRKCAARQTTSQAGVVDSQPLTHKSVRLPGRKKKCKQCQKEKKHTQSGRGVETVYGCVICCVNLCPGNCFAIFHQHLAKAVE